VSGPHQRQNSGSFEIPDLELPPPAPSKSQSGLRAIAPQAAGPSSTRADRVLSTELELPEANGGRLTLDLDVSGPISGREFVIPYSSGANFAEGGLDLDSVAPALANIVVAPEARTDWPTGVTPERGRLVLDPREVQLVADFGEPSRFGPLNITYALRVTRGRLRLKAALRELEAELSRAERRRDERLAELADTLRPSLEANDGFKRLLTPLAEIEALHGERGAALARVQTEGRIELGGFSTELDRARGALHEFGTEAGALEGTLATRSHARERLEAREKRCFIEMRAIQTQAAQRIGPAGGVMPDDLAERLAKLEAELAASKPELDQARAMELEAERELSRLRRQKAEQEKALTKIEQRQRDTKARLERNLGARSEGLGETSEGKRTALANLGRAVLATRGGVAAEPAQIRLVQEAEQAVSALAKQAELHLRALGAADGDKVRSGAAWLLILLSAATGYLTYRIWFAR
jgi:hypothetical protein